MSVSKTFLTAGTLAFAGLFGGGVYVLMNLGSIAEKRIEKVASATLGVNVDIGTLDVSLQDRRAVASGIKIANPPGFKKSHAVTVDTVSVDLGLLSKELITFEDVSVRGTEVNLEVTERTTNLHTIKKNIKPKASRSAEEEAIKVIFDKIQMSDAKINPSVTLFDTQELDPIMLSNLLLRDVGKKENGVLVSEAVAQISKQLFQDFNAAAGKAGYLQGMSGDALKEMGVSQINQVRDQITNEINAVGDKLKGIFSD